MKRTPDVVIAAWLASTALLVGLAYFVVHQLTGDSTMPASHAFFRADAPTTTSALLGWKLITAWQLNSVAIAVVAAAAVCYLLGVYRLRVRQQRAWPLRSTVSFLLGLVVIVLATCASIAVYDSALFSAHMIGHLFLVMLAPALLVLGHPLALLQAVSSSERAAQISKIMHGSAMSLLTSPPVALASYAVVIVGSHLTGLMNIIMSHTWAGQLEHLAYLLVGCQFFAVILGDPPLRWQLSTPIRWLLLAISMAVDTFTGVVLMMSTTPMTMSTPHGVGALSDTRTGGGIMWFGGDGIMAVIMVTLAIDWMRNEGRNSRERSSWLEQARDHTLAERSALTASIGSSDPGVDGLDIGGLDDSDSQRDAYNQWLAEINKNH